MRRLLLLWCALILSLAPSARADCGEQCDYGDGGYAECSAGCSGQGPGGIHSCLQKCGVKLKVCVKKACPEPKPKPEPKPTEMTSGLYRNWNFMVEDTDKVKTPDICGLCLAPSGNKPRACALTLCVAPIDGQATTRKLFDLRALSNATTTGAGTLPIGNICTHCLKNPSSPACMRMMCVPPDPKLDGAVKLQPLDAAAWKSEIAKTRDFAELLQKAGEITKQERTLLDDAALKDFRSIQVVPAGRRATPP